MLNFNFLSFALLKSKIDKKSRKLAIGGPESFRAPFGAGLEPGPLKRAQNSYSQILFRPGTLQTAH